MKAQDFFRFLHNPTKWKEQKCFSLWHEFELQPLLSINHSHYNEANRCKSASQKTWSIAEMLTKKQFLTVHYNANPKCSRKPQLITCRLRANTHTMVNLIFKTFKLQFTIHQHKLGGCKRISWKFLQLIRITWILLHTMTDAMFSIKRLIFSVKSFVYPILCSTDWKTHSWVVNPYLLSQIFFHKRSETICRFVHETYETTHFCLHLNKNTRINSRTAYEQYQSGVLRITLYQTSELTCDSNEVALNSLGLSLPRISSEWNGGSNKKTVQS